MFSQGLQILHDTTVVKMKYGGFINSLAFQFGTDVKFMKTTLD